MDADRYARLRQLFAAARQIDGAARDEFVETECAGDAEMRRELEELLVHDEPSQQQSLEARVVEAARDLDSIPDAALPERIGRYRILGVLGEGGMGTVYRAEQTEPIRREVALKLMRDGMPSAGLRARFETERQTLALMDHPNIAKVFDADYDEQGRPYLGMELVEGRSITDHCRHRELSLRDRLTLLLEVCRGVGHAHRKGVIHRDLKPSNILVRESKAGSVPKLIDFSIAKSLEESLSEEPHRTRTGQVIGTLSYMSPEQARGEIADIDTRSDVYSLGVVAYELLTGRTPHEVNELPIHEAVRRVSDDVVASLKTTQGGTKSAERVPADVATIVEKCLAKEPDRRYRNADELADDLERFLTSRPILARPPSTIYQLRMLAGRHRLAVAAVLLLLGFLVIYGVTVSVQLQAQRAERLRAEAAAGEARREARRATRVLDFLQGVLASAAPSGEQETLTVRELLDRTAGRIDLELAAEPEALADAHRTLGRSYQGLGQYDTSLEHFQRAMELHVSAGDKETPDALRDRMAIVGIQHLAGEYDEAVTAAYPLLETLRAREDEDPPPVPPEELLSFQISLANIETDRRQLEEAESLARDAVRRAEQIGLPEDSTLLASARQGLAFVLWSRGGDDRLTEAERLAGLALAEFETRSGSHHPTTLGCLNMCAVILDAQKRHLDSAAVQREALERRRRVYEPGHPDIAVGAHNLATALLNLGMIAAAEPYQREALENWRETLGPDHLYVALATSNVAFMQQALGNLDEAEALYREAIAVSGEGASQARASAEWNLAILLRDQRRSLGEAEAILRRALERLESETGRESKPWAQALQDLGFVLLEQGRTKEAGDLLRQASLQLGAIDEDEPVWADVGLAILYDQRGERAEARRSLDRVSASLLSGGPPPHQIRYLATEAARLADRWGDVELAEKLRAELRRRDELAESQPDLERLLEQVTSVD